MKTYEQTVHFQLGVSFRFTVMTDETVARSPNVYCHLRQLQLLKQTFVDTFPLIKSGTEYLQKCLLEKAPNFRIITV